MKLTIWFIGLLIRTRPYAFAALWLFMLWLFVYLTSLDLFREIWLHSGLGFFDKISFMFDSVKNVILNITDPRAFSLFVFSFVASVNMLLMWQTLKRRRQLKGTKMSTAGSVGAIVGSHCIACGGSFVAPLVTTIAGSGAYFSAERVNTAITFSVIVNGIAILLVGRTTLKMASQEKEFILQKDAIAI